MWQYFNFYTKNIQFYRSMVVLFQVNVVTCHSYGYKYIFKEYSNKKAYVNTRYTTYIYKKFKQMSFL